MKLLSRLAALVCVLCLLMSLAGKPVGAKFAYFAPVPIERLLKNVGEYVRAHPQDAQGLYTLGRLHSLAFAYGNKKVSIITKDFQTDKPLPLPIWPGYSTWAVERPADLAKRRTEALLHLKESLRLYKQAVGMDASNSLYWLSNGWMLEQGMAFASEVNAPFLSKPAKAKPAVWREQAIQAYLKAFDLSREKDAGRDYVFEGRDIIVSQEAGDYLLRLAKEKPTPLITQAKKEEIEAQLKTMKLKPIRVTPILFPLGSPQPLNALLAPGKQVNFDLAGTGLHTRWPWVRPDTGILVWDPNHTGKITSGLQLFGSMTWQMFWKNGYEPLAALDDDHNGWLEKAELRGLACWQDRNGNGKADPGEVVPLTKLGVVRLAVHPAGKQADTLFHPAGIQFRNGTSLPTYDWTPTSLPEPNYRTAQNRPKRETPELAGTLTRVDKTDQFELRLQNVTDHPVLAVRWYWLYELRIFDKQGKQLSANWEKAFHWDEPVGIGELGWIALLPQESFCFELEPRLKKGDTKMPATAWRVECVCHTEWIHQKPPNFITKYKLKMAKLPVIPAISLQPQSLALNSDARN